MNVITAAVMGSIICGWLVVLALACARRLHFIRIHGPAAAAALYGGGGDLGSSTMQIQDHIFARCSAPPLYDVAMATSRPFHEAQRDLELQRQRRQREEGEAADVESGHESSSGGSAPPSYTESPATVTIMPPGYAVSQLDVVEEEDEESEDDVTMSQYGVHWRRSQPNRTSSSLDSSYLKSDDSDDDDDSDSSSMQSTEQSSLGELTPQHSPQQSPLHTQTTNTHSSSLMQIDGGGRGGDSGEEEAVAMVLASESSNHASLRKEEEGGGGGGGSDHSQVLDLEEEDSVTDTALLIP